MKRPYSIIAFFCCILAFVSSCEKAPLLVLNTPSSISFTEQGGTQKVSFTANRDWTVSSSESWCKVSPSSGSKADGELSFTVTCDPNTTYDPRNATVTIKADELMETISVTQDTNLGMLVSQTSYSISNEEQTIEVEVKANVNYVVDIPSDCKDWISHISTKSLTTRTLVLRISENKAYDDRTGYVTVRQTDGPLAETITINQKQADGIVVSASEYRVSSERQSLEIGIEFNVDFEIIPEAEWIHYVETKALTSKSFVLFVDENFDLASRVGSIMIKSSRLEKRITVNQEPDVAIDFEDLSTKRLCVQNWDINGDGELSINEANFVSSLRNVFEGSDISSFNELRYFKGIETINYSAFKNCDELVSIYIPESVTTIGDSAFWGCSSLQNIDIPISVLSIQDTAFWGCTALTSIIIPDSVLEIGGCAFYGCSSLKSVRLSCLLKVINHQVFRYCTSLSSIAIPDKVTEVAYAAFDGCSSLCSITLPPSLSTIDVWAFRDCSSLAEILMPDSVMEIGSGAFNNCSSLSSVIVSNSLRCIPQQAFGGCSSLTSIVLSNSLETIDDSAFSRCKSLSSIIIPDSVTSIEHNAFYGCSSLSSIKLSNNLKTIGVNAFYSCDNLTSIIIPDSVTSVGTYSFKGCYNLASITIEAVIPPTGGDLMFEKYPKYPIFVPAESVEAYKSAQYWSEYADRIQAIPSTTGEINGHAYVDMGNSLKWATCNVGANSPEEYGQYFAWGEVKQKADYSESKYDYNKEFEDAASINWGATWRMPTEEEWAWLLDNCDWNWTEDKGVKGYRVASRATGNSIFLPAAGFYDDEALLFVGRSGLYWSSSSPGSETYFKKYVHFHDERAFLSDGNRFDGFSVRPISE